MDWIQSASLLPFYVVVMVTGERSQRRPSRVSSCFLYWSSLSSPRKKSLSKSSPYWSTKGALSPVT